MCTELLLAILYFAVLFGVNYFLFKLLFSYSRSISSELKKIYILKSLSEEIIPWELLESPVKKRKNLSPVRLFIQDLLIIGNSYIYISQEKRKNKREEGKSESYYFELLKQQHLSLLMNEN